jgi:Kef-type K+ transport system membrane component KefB
VDAIIAHIIGEIALVFVLSSLLGVVAQRLGQPRVIGQILAGILLGPTLLGQLPGHLTSHLFPKATLLPISVLANVAVVIFMFVVGYELDLRSLRGTRRAAPLVAAGALLIPMALGMAAVFVFRPGFEALGGPHHPSRSFVLFIGVAVSISALPVLASIVRERGIAGTTAGITATAAAGIMDALAWLVLAAALVGTGHKPGRPLAVTAVLIVAFAAAMLAIVRPGLRWWIRRQRSLLSNQLLIAVALALGSAWVTAALGLHPVFGGFLAGLTMPSLDGSPDESVLRPLEEAANLLLPLFFVVTGLSLNIGSLGGEAFAMLALVCVIASAGKAGPAYVASRAGGLAPRESAAVAALVNARGLTELIALNVGLADGIIGRKLFSVLVLMALIMTVLTAPVLAWIRLPRPAAPEPEPVPAARQPAYPQPAAAREP